MVGCLTREPSIESLLYFLLFICEPNFFGMKSCVFVEWLQSGCWRSQSRYSRFEWSSVLILCYDREIVFVFLGISRGEKKTETKFLSQYPVCSFTVSKLCLWKPKYSALPSTYYNFMCCSLSGSRLLATCGKNQFLT